MNMIDDDAMDERNGEANGNGEASALDRLIAKIPEGDLRSLLAELAGKDPEIRNIISIRYSDDFSDAEFNRIKCELDRIMVIYTNSYYYSISYDYGAKLSGFMSKYIPDMIGSGKYKAATEIAIEVYEKIGQYGEDDEDGVFREVMNDCLGYWREIQRKCTPKFQLEMMERLRDAVFEEREFEEYNSEILDLIKEEFQGRECLERKLEWAEDSVAYWDDPNYEGNEEHRLYNLGLNVVDKLNLMASLSYPQAELDALAAEYLELPAVRMWEAGNLESQGKIEDAVTMLEESRHLDSEDSSLVSMETEMLVHLYEKTGRDEDCKRELEYFIFDCYQSGFYKGQYGLSTFDYVMKLKAICSPDEWTDYMEKILERGNIVSKYDLLDEEGMYQRLLDEILKEKSQSLMNAYEDKLKPLFPVQLRQFYADRVIEDSKTSYGRADYADLADTLKKISSYPDGQTLAMDIASRLKADNPRKRALADELRKAGF